MGVSAAFVMLRLPHRIERVEIVCIAAQGALAEGSGVIEFPLNLPQHALDHAGIGRG